MDIRELKALTHKCAKEINNIVGYDAVNMDNIRNIKYNGRLKNALGRARRYSFSGEFDIEFSKSYFTFDGTSLDDKTSVVYHELVHTIDGCFDHGYRFNNICRAIERQTGIEDIAGSRKKDTSNYRASNTKYQIACTRCDVKAFRHKTMIRGRQEGIVERYSCRCGGKLEQTLNR